MRILITGGFGFIGGRVAQHLQQLGHQITLGSRNGATTPAWLPQANVIQTCWESESSLVETCNNTDLVIQAAGMNARDCTADPVAALEFNGLATARLVRAAGSTGIKRFIYLSTAHVYASPLAGNITESSCPRNLHPYATSHLAGEQVVLSASQRGQIHGTVLRVSNSFGAPSHAQVNCWTLLLNDLCKQAAQTRRMVLQSSGTQLRDFIAMTEVCRIIAHLASPDLSPSMPGIVNIGSGFAHSVLDMAKLVQQRCKLVLGFEPELQYPAAQTDEAPTLLSYQSAGLAALGLAVNPDKSTEIDRLLSFCHTAFEPGGVA